MVIEVGLPPQSKMGLGALILLLALHVWSQYKSPRWGLLYWLLRSGIGFASLPSVGRTDDYPLRGSRLGQTNPREPKKTPRIAGCFLWLLRSGSNRRPIR